MDPRDLADTTVSNDANRLLWAIWSFTVASAVFLALRIYCKLSRARTLWWDDHFLVASWVSTYLTLTRVRNLVLRHDDTGCSFSCSGALMC